MTETVQYCLKVIVGKSYGEEFVLSPGEERVIGADAAADIRLKGDGVEPRHARVLLERDELRVVDIGNKKSMKVNGGKQRSARLENGDQLSLGGVTLRVQRRITTVVEDAKQKRAPARGSAPAPPPATVAEGEAAGPADAPPTTSPSVAVEVLERAEVPHELSREESAGTMSLLEEHGLWWPKDELPPLELQHVWFDLARHDSWRSLAVVPTDASTPTLPVAHAFARMASLNPHAHVLLVDATPREALYGRGRPFAGTIASQVKQFPQANYDFLDASSLGMNDAEVAHLYIPQLLEYISSGTARYNKVLIAVGSLLQHARSIPVARAVDAVLLSVGVGTSRLPDVNRTLDIVGRERVMGSLTVEAVD